MSDQNVRIKLVTFNGIMAAIAAGLATGSCHGSLSASGASFRRSFG